MIGNHQSIFQQLFLRRDFRFAYASATKSLLLCNRSVKISFFED